MNKIEIFIGIMVNVKVSYRKKHKRYYFFFLRYSSLYVYCLLFILDYLYWNILLNGIIHFSFHFFFKYVNVITLKKIFWTFEIFIAYKTHSNQLYIPYSTQNFKWHLFFIHWIFIKRIIIIHFTHPCILCFQKSKSVKTQTVHSSLW